MSDTLTYRSQAALELCETLLIPGGKARVSPYLKGLVPESERFLIPVYLSVTLDLVRGGYLPDAVSLLDYDAPFGIGACVMLDTVLAWHTARALYDLPPVLRSTRVGVHNGDARHSRLPTFWSRLRERAHHLPALALEHGLDSREVASQDANVVLVAFPWQKCAEVARLMDSLPPDAIIAAVAWQRDAVLPEQIFAWRYELLRERADFVALGPCGQEYGRDLPPACATCVHGQRMVLHCAAGEITAPPPWSYVLLIKRATPVESPVPAGLAAADMAHSAIPDLRARYLGTVHEKAIVVAHPDATRDDPADTRWHTYLRLCPGHSDLTRLAIQSDAGSSMPRLRYGEWVSVQNAHPHTPYADAPDIGLLRLPDGMPQPQGGGLPVSATFLPAYTAKTRAALDEAAYRLFGFPKLHAFQHTVLERALRGGDIFAIAATGGGKSECYILPAMLLPGITVVVSPLKSLMQDQYDQRIRERYGLDYLTTAINGDVPFHERQGRLRRLVGGYFKLLYVTPEQLERGYILDALHQADQTVGIRYLAMDEAHCISQWGHDFRPSYLNIVERLHEHRLSPQRIALTATASPRVRDDVCQELHLRPQNLSTGGDVFIHTSNRPELNLVVCRARSTEDKARIIVNALRELQDGAAIVFMPHTGGNPKQPYNFHPPASAPHPDNAGMVSPGVSPFVRYLHKHVDAPIAMYHGAMKDSRARDGASNAGSLTRRAEQARFMRGEKQVMVATKGFGMGIDKADIRLVIHRSPTANLEAYAQEAGRAGRDGKLATVMLLFSEDQPRITKASPDDFLPRDTLQSDREIQAFFTEQRYVRRVDVEALIAFMRAKSSRRIPGSLYFTGDQVIALLDTCEQHPEVLELAQPYRWPQFPPRRAWSYESEAHRHILDQGHIYQAKCQYIGRILKVLYNNRPTLDGQVIPLIRAAHKTGLIMRDFRIAAPERIISAPAYFGARLREHAVSARELHALLPDGDQVDLTPLAARLGLSLRETAAMLYDIRHAAGQPDHYGRWAGDWLHYTRLEAPRWVNFPAPYTTAAWRDYAGAHTRRKGGQREVLDDYFPEWTLNRPVGWEVVPGTGLNYPDRHAYLDAFMQLHDERRANDDRNFAYLIERYIGAEGSAAKCLRSLLLGYLKTGEVIAGGNCLGCSVCVPHLDFERHPVADRERVVKRLMIDTLTWLEQLEACNRQPPPVELWQGVLQAIAEEDARGRSGSAYLDSWLARLLQDDPEHLGALWLRLRAVEQHALALSPPDVVSALTRLAASEPPRALLPDLRRMTSQCLETRDYAPHRGALLCIAAQLAGQCEVWAEEAQFWQQALDITPTQSPEAREILARLLALYRRAEHLHPALAQDPGALLALAERLLAAGDANAVELLCRAWVAGAALSAAQMHTLAENLLALEPAMVRAWWASHQNVVPLLRDVWHARGQPEFPLAWLAYFPAGTLGQLPEDLFAPVWTALLDTQAAVDDRLLDDLAARLGATARADTAYLKQLATARPDLAARLFKATLRQPGIPKAAILKALSPAVLRHTVTRLKAS